MSTTTTITQPNDEGDASLAAQLDGSGVQLAHGRRNFGLMALYQVIMRTGWIFKTESIIMPAVLDMMGGAAWLRGCLPMLNRFGQSIPPLVAASYLQRMAIKKYALAACSFLMGAMFLVLAVLWFNTPDRQIWWMPVCFLVIYGIFFFGVGINQLVLSTLNGKLVLVHRRGRLIIVANFVGVFSAVTCATLLLPGWLNEGARNFGSVFAFAGSCFVLGAIVVLLFREQRDKRETAYKRVNVVRSTIALLKSDRNFRRLALVAGLFGMSLTLFPHYQALAFTRLELSVDILLWWLIAQNIGVAIISFPVGWMADRYGNRLVLQLAMLGLCIAPTLSMIFAGFEAGGNLFIIVFAMLGLTPVTMRSLNNYTLELAPRSEQPQYLSVLSLFIAGPPILSSTLLGWTVGKFGFEPVFAIVTVMIFAGWIVTFSLSEPRRKKTDVLTVELPV